MSEDGRRTDIKNLDEKTCMTVIAMSNGKFISRPSHHFVKANGYWKCLNCSEERK